MQRRIIYCIFSARCNIYISRLCYDVSVRLSVCDGSALWSLCMPRRGDGSSHAMLATARPSCLWLGNKIDEVWLQISRKGVVGTDEILQVARGGLMYPTTPGEPKY